MIDRTLFTETYYAPLEHMQMKRIMNTSLQIWKGDRDNEKSCLRELGYVIPMANTLFMYPEPLVGILRYVCSNREACK